MPRKLVRWAGPGATFLIGVGLQVGGWVQPAAGAAFVLIAAMWAVLALPPISSRLPRVAFERSGSERTDAIGGWTVRYLPGQRLSARRMKAETLSFVQDLHDFVESHDWKTKSYELWSRAAHEAQLVRGTPDEMAIIGSLARVLGPRGLLPNKKTGTVTYDVETIIKDLKRGRTFFRNDKQGIVHFSIGNVSSDTQNLHENMKALVKAVVASKPATAKGKYLKKITLSSTMGIGIPTNADEIVRFL